MSRVLKCNRFQEGTAKKHESGLENDSKNIEIKKGRIVSNHGWKNHSMSKP